MTFQIETERLLLREITVQDALFAFELNNDPEVLRYTGDEPFLSVEEARTFLEQYSHYHDYGFGRWLVIRKSDQESLGWCGLKYSETKKEVDIGFRFHRKHWNQGYASESALACLEVGFSQFNMPEIIGRAQPKNIASIRVLEKIGLNYINDEIEEGLEWSIFQIKNPNVQ